MAQIEVNFILINYYNRFEFKLRPKDKTNGGLSGSSGFRHPDRNKKEYKKIN